MVQGIAFLKYESLKQVYSDKQGKYELVLDVPKKFNSVNVGIPFGLTDNPKYENNYSGNYIWKNDESTNNCCLAPIGEKTKYDFKLIAKN